MTEKEMKSKITQAHTDGYNRGYAKREEEIGMLNSKVAELEQELQYLKDSHAEEVELHLHAEEYIKSLEEQIEKMKCCSNCKHFNKAEDNEYCWNCERHLVNSLDNLLREEIIKDEWELRK